MTGEGKTFEADHCAPSDSFDQRDEEGRRDLLSDQVTETHRQAWKKLIRLLSVRDRSICECRRKLAEADFDSASCDYAIEKAQRLRLLDDQRFADYFIRAKLASGKGLRGIEEALADHGISTDSLPGYPEEYFEQGEDEVERAYAFLCKRPPRSKNPWKSAYGKLLRAGYESDVAYQASSRWVTHVKAS